MNELLPKFLIVFIYFLIPPLNFAQTPDLGTTSTYALFTAVGAFSNTGASMVTGDIGTNVGAFSGFPPGTVVGNTHVADPASAQAATDVDVAYGFMSTITCGTVIATTMGSGQMLTPDVYCLGAASTINGDLLLDGMGDANSVFIFKIDGALATTVNSRVILTNSASLCNVYWQVNGQVDLGANSEFRGTLLVNGAINLLDAASLDGRGLSRSGAISLQNNNVNIPPVPTAATITANGSSSLCAGETLILSGNTAGGIWSTGATTTTIAVTMSGDYFVTNSNDCGDAVSNHIIVTLVQAPLCTITGNNSICEGQSTQLCVPGGADSYLWSTGATTNCIMVSTADTYAVTVTTGSCSSICSTTVVVDQQPICTITGNNSICEGQSTQLCVPGGADSYLWSTGATTNCIMVSTANTYAVTVTTGSCSSICSTIVVVDQQPEISCPPPMTVDCFAAVPPCNGSDATVVDICMLYGAPICSLGLPVGDDCGGSIIKTYTISDGAGNSASCMQLITIVPPLPTFNQLPADDLQLSCNVLPQTSFLGWTRGTGLCQTTGQVQSTLIGAPDLCEGFVTERWEYIDECLVTIFHERKVFYKIDVERPILLGVPDDIYIPCGSNFPSWPLVTAIDNCGPISVTRELQETGKECGGKFYERIWTAIDDCGNIATAKQTIRLIDTKPPVLTIPNDTTIFCPGTVPEPEYTSYDECSLSNVVYTEEKISHNACAFTLIRTWTATDACKKSIQRSQIIEVIDTTPPVIEVLNPMLMSLGLGGEISIYSCEAPRVSTSDIGVNDCCVDVNITTYDKLLVHGKCQLFGYHQKWKCGYIATDESGNSSEFYFYVILYDTIAPVLNDIPQDTTIACGQEIPALDDNLVTAQDNCSSRTLPTITQQLLLDTTDASQTLVRKWSFADDCGNSVEASQIITFCDMDTTQLGIDTANMGDTSTIIDTSTVNDTSTVIDSSTVIDTSTANEPFDSSLVVGGEPPATIDSTGLIVEVYKYLSNFEVYPIPTRHMLNIRFQVLESGDVQIKLLDKFGRVIKLHTKYLMQGQYPDSFDLSSYPNGLYWIVLDLHGDIQYKSVIKVD